MKKIIALMMLCLLLCAMSATAFAAKVRIMDTYNYDYDNNELDDDYYCPYIEIEEKSDTYSLPQYNALGLVKPENKEFYGWRIYGLHGYSVHYKPGCKIDVSSDNVLNTNGVVRLVAEYIDEGAQTYEVKLISDEFNENKVVGYYGPVSTAEGSNLIELAYPYQCGFGTDWENIEYFLHWEVIEGNIEMFDPSDEPDDPSLWGMFPRALADDPDILNPEDYFYVNSDLVIKAIWKNGGGNTQPPAPQYNVSASSDGNGEVSVSKSQAKAGDTITITVKPNGGYGLKELKAISDETVNIVNNAFVMPACNVEIQATFEKRNEVIFDANGGECTVAKTAVNANNKLDELPKATHANKLFIGWFTAKDGGEAVTKDTVFAETETTVYAHWYDAQHTTKPEDNAFYADIDMDDSDILNLLIDDEDMADQKNIIVYLSVKEEEESKVDPTEKDAITAKAGEDKIAAYLNVQLFKKIGDKDAFPISNTKGKVHIMLQLDDEIVSQIPGNAVKDSFYIIYYHEGNATKIEANFNTATRVLDFYADEFSTYSLVYKTRNANVSLPQTGDNSLRIDFLFVAMLASLVGLRLMAKKRIN